MGEEGVTAAERGSGEGPQVCTSCALLWCGLVASPMHMIFGSVTSCCRTL